MRRASKFRMVPSEHAGYGPGSYVVQGWFPEVGVWGDIGDPKPWAAAYREMHQEMQDLHRETRVRAPGDEEVTGGTQD